MAACLLLSSAAVGSAAPTSDYRNRTIYFIVTDRFHPHQPYDPYVDPNFPDATNSVNCFDTPCPAEDLWRRYWGGDIQGIIEQLDYIHHLGASAVWVTPLMENVPGYEGGTGYGTGYHGYWVQNYDAVNPHFGTWSDVNQLSAALHARGMRYIQDITLNDSNPNDNHAYGQLDQYDTPSAPFVRSYADDYDPATGRRIYKHYQQTAACQAAAKIADSMWDDWQLHHCLLADLSGYDQRNRTIADYLIAAGKLWSEQGVDDFRLDAIKFPFPSFVARFTGELTDYVTGQSRAAPYFVGEWSNGGVGDNRSLAFANQYDVYHTNLLDFQLSFVLNRFIGGSLEEPEQATSGADLDAFLKSRLTAFDGRDDWQGTFLDNHDELRTLVRLQKLGVQSDVERERRLDLGTVLLMTVRGIPIIFYGDEQYLAHYEDGHDTPPQYVNSDNDDPFNRLGMTRFSESTPNFTIVAALAYLRANGSALASGSYRGLSADQDTLVFERQQGPERVLVAVNRGPARDLRLASLDVPAGSYPSLLADTSDVNRPARLTVAGDGSATIHLEQLGTLVVGLPAPTP